MTAEVGESFNGFGLYVLDSAGNVTAEIQPDGTEIRLSAQPAPASAPAPEQATPAPIQTAATPEPEIEPDASSVAAASFPIQPVLIAIAVICVIAAVWLFIRAGAKRP